MVEPFAGEQRLGQRVTQTPHARSHAGIESLRHAAGRHRAEMLAVKLEHRPLNRAAQGVRLL